MMSIIPRSCLVLIGGLAVGSGPGWLRPWRPYRAPRRELEPSSPSRSKQPIPGVDRKAVQEALRRDLGRHSGLGTAHEAGTRDRPLAELLDAPR
jgi:hypothetical protein